MKPYRYTAVVTNTERQTLYQCTSICTTSAQHRLRIVQPQQNAVFRQCLTCSAKHVHWKPRKIQNLVVLERWSHCCMVNTDRPALVTTEATVIIRNTCCLHRTHNRAEVSEANLRWHRNCRIVIQSTQNFVGAVFAAMKNSYKDGAPTPRIRRHNIFASRYTKIQSTKTYQVPMSSQPRGSGRRYRCSSFQPE
jgi:hypothetical protein